MTADDPEGVLHRAGPVAQMPGDKMERSFDMKLSKKVAALEAQHDLLLAAVKATITVIRMSRGKSVDPRHTLKVAEDGLIEALVQK